MAGIYIANLELPHGDESTLVWLQRDGSVVYYTGNCPPFGTITHAIELSNHGDLIDRDEVLNKDYQIYRKDGAAIGRRHMDTSDISEAPTVIPASKEGET